MNPFRWRILVGGALVLMGILALLNTVFSIDLGGLIWAAIFLLAGFAFVYVLVSDRKAWWAAFPGFTLLGIGLLIGVGELAPRVADAIGGAFVLGGIGLSFLVVYLLNRSFWWALIPMGVMASLVVMLLLEPVMRDDVAWVFLLGLALTFGLLWFVPGSAGERMTWPLYPAVVLLVVAMITMVSTVAWAGYVWPVVLIVGGGLLVWRAIGRK